MITDYLLEGFDKCLTREVVEDVIQEITSSEASVAHQAVKARESIECLLSERISVTEIKKEEGVISDSLLGKRLDLFQNRKSIDQGLQHESLKGEVGQLVLLPIEKITLKMKVNPSIRPILKMVSINIDRLLLDIDLIAIELPDVGLCSCSIPISTLPECFGQKSYLLPLVEYWRSISEEGIEIISAEQLKKVAIEMQQKVSFLLRKSLYDQKIRYNPVGIPLHPLEIELLDIMKGKAKKELIPEKYIPRHPLGSVGFIKKYFARYVEAKVLYLDNIRQIDLKLYRSLYNSSEKINFLPSATDRVASYKEEIKRNGILAEIAKKLHNWM